MRPRTTFPAWRCWPVTIEQLGPVATTVGRMRVVRRFSNQPIPDDVIDLILDSGRHAGSSKNTQPWTFVVVRDRERLERLGKVGNWAGHLAGAAAGIALVTPDPATADAPLSMYWDLGQASQNMRLV